MSTLLSDILNRGGELTFTSGLILAVVIMLAAMAPMSRTVVNVVSGAVFGLGAIPIVIPSATLGAVIAFLLARYFLFRRLRQTADRRPRLRAVVDAIDIEGWRILVLLRLASPIPSFVLNYLFGLTKTRLLTYASITLAAMIPNASLHIYLGSVGKAALVSGWSDLNLLLSALAAISLLCVITLVTHRLALGRVPAPQPADRQA